MLSFRRTLDVPKFELSRYSKSLHKAISEILRKAATEWLRFLITHVPVETGMAKAALQPLANYLKTVHFDIRSEAWRSPYRSKRKPPLGYLVSIEEGIRKTDHYVKDDKRARDDHIFSFFWSTKIVHFWVEEYYHTRFDRPAGEELLAEAKKIFVAEMNTRLQTELPKYARFLKVRSAGSSKDVPF